MDALLAFARSQHMGIRFQTRPFTVNGDQGNFIQDTAADWLALPTVVQIKG
jgi:hypothetical protein